MKRGSGFRSRLRLPRRLMVGLLAGLLCLPAYALDPLTLLLLRAVRDAGHPVVWACDPMHGNTFTAPNGRKTRDVNDIIAECNNSNAKWQPDCRRGHWSTEHGEAEPASRHPGILNVTRSLPAGNRQQEK